MNTSIIYVTSHAIQSYMPLVSSKTFLALAMVHCNLLTRNLLSMFNCWAQACILRKQSQSSGLPSKSTDFVCKLSRNPSDIHFILLLFKDRCCMVSTPARGCHLEFWYCCPAAKCSWPLLYRKMLLGQRLIFYCAAARCPRCLCPCF